MKVNLFGSNNLSDGSHKSGALLDQFPKKQSLQRCIRALTGLALGAASSLSFGLGLGDIEPKSFLGQPLAANIELVSLDGDIDLDTLLVRQVSSAEAEKMGVDIYYSGYRFDLKIDESSGQPKVTIVSKNSIDEPYLNILVELRWPSGVVYREYPLLLDPPPLVPVSSIESRASNKKAVAAVAKAQKPSTRSTSSPQTASVTQKPSPSKPIKAGKGDAYKVQSGDTLWNIAKRWREGTDLSINETMAWLHENNPAAFANGDMNRLRAGARLKMPDLSKLQLEDGLLPAPVRSSVAIEESAPLEPVSAKDSKKELEILETESVIDESERPEHGLLVVSSELQSDRSRELIDMLSRENEDLKERMKKIENSEYLNTLKQLVSLQRRQISELRASLGVRDTSSEEMSALLNDANVDVNSGVNSQSTEEVEQNIAAIEENLGDETAGEVEALASENTEDIVQAKITEEESLVELEPVLANPPEAKTDKSLVTWLVFGAGAFLAMIFAFLLIYYRKMVPTKNRGNYEEEGYQAGSSFSAEHHYSGHFDKSSESEEAMRMVSDRTPDISYDGEDISNYVDDENADWLGEKVDNIDTFDAGAFDNAIQEVEDIFDSITPDETAVSNPDGILEGFTNELPNELPGRLISELSDEVENSNEEFLDSLNTLKEESKERRADHEVLSSIAAKMSQYSPVGSSESLGMLDLDESAGEDLEALDEVDATVSRAKMFCEFSQYDRAKDLIEKSMENNSDERYVTALENINKVQAKSQRQEQDTPNAGDEGATQIEGFTTSLDDEPSGDELEKAVVGDFSEEHVDDATEFEIGGLSKLEDGVGSVSNELERETAESSFEEVADIFEDSTELLSGDTTEVLLDELSDEDNVSEGLLEEALKANFSVEEIAYGEESLDLDLDIDIDFNDIDLEQDIQIDELDDQIEDEKKKRVSC